MSTGLEDRVERLEQKVDHLVNEEVRPLKAQVDRLDTWAGPGQNETLSSNLAELRKMFRSFAKVQAGHTRKLDTLTKDVAGLKTDVAGLKADMVEVKDRLGEILDRLPPRQETPGR